MKKKIYLFLLILASAIACIVCISACGSGDGSGGANRDEYVGKYEFVSMHIASEIDGEKFDIDYVVGEDGITKDFYVLDLKADGKFLLSVSDGNGSMEGTWTVKGGKLAVISKDGSAGSFQNVSLSDGILTMTFDGGQGPIASTVLKLKKVTEEKPAE